MNITDVNFKEVEKRMALFNTIAKVCFSAIQSLHTPDGDPLAEWEKVAYHIREDYTNSVILLLKDKSITEENFRNAKLKDEANLKNQMGIGDFEPALIDPNSRTETQKRNDKLFVAIVRALQNSTMEISNED